MEGVLTERIGEGVAVVSDGVEAELERLGGGASVGNARLEYRYGRVRALDPSLRVHSGLMEWILWAGARGWVGWLLGVARGVRRVDGVDPEGLDG